MKPTEEQVIAWAREAGMRVGARRLFTAQDRDLLRLAVFSYEAGRKDENEACVEEAAYYAAHSLTAKNILDAIRARRKQ